MILPWLLLACALPPALADADARVFHRLVVPGLSDAKDLPFTPRGTLSLTGSGPTAHASLVPAASLSADLLEFANIIRDHRDDTLYQLALEHRGSPNHPTQWDISSVKACHLLQATSEQLRVHLTQDGTPFALDYFVGPVPHDGACPKARRRKTTAEAEGPAALRHVQNTTVELVAPRLPPLPTLRVPPPLAPDGKPVEPVPEKTFLQKYWMYIVVVLVALLMSPAQEEEKGSGSGAAAAGGGRR